MSLGFKRLKAVMFKGHAVHLKSWPSETSGTTHPTTRRHISKDRIRRTLQLQYRASVKMAGMEFCTAAARCRVGLRTSIYFDPESWHSVGKRKPVVWFRCFSFSFPLLTSVALRNLAAAGCKMQFQWCRLVWRLGCTNLVPQQSLNLIAVQVGFFFWIIQTAEATFM